jgi:hypothetical protein
MAQSLPKVTKGIRVQKFRENFFEWTVWDGDYKK